MERADLCPLATASTRTRRPEGYVAACKNAGGGGHQVLVNLEDPRGGHLHSFFAAEEREVGLLTDGQDHAVAGNSLSLSSLNTRIEAAVFIKDC